MRKIHNFKSLISYIFFGIPVLICFFCGLVPNVPESIFGNAMMLFMGINLLLVFLSHAIRKYEKNKRTADWFLLLEVLTLAELVLFYVTGSVFTIVGCMIIKSVKLFVLMSFYNSHVKEKIFKADKFVFAVISILCDILCYVLKSFGIASVIIMVAVLICLNIKLYRALKETKTIKFLQAAHIFFSSGIMCFSLIFCGNQKNVLNIYAFFCFAVCAVLWCYTFLKDFADDRTSEIENAEMNLHLKNEEMAVMLSQIKPHFIYNTLNTIQYLCRVDPDLAADTVSDFSDYLRTNLNFDSTRQIVPFEEELEHINRYLKIEKLRFKHRLKIKYQIEDDNFYVPTLSIQPIVENAVKHGISKRLNGGVITISSYMGESDYVVSVKDNGVGFVRKEKGKNRKSLGLKNIKNRIEILLGGRLVIETKENIGTEVKIFFPVERNLKEVEKV